MRPIVIEHSKEATAICLALIANLAIQSVRLVEATVTGIKDEDWQDVDGSIDTEITFRPAEATFKVGEDARSSGSLTLIVEFTFRILQTISSGVRDILSIRCQFESKYAVKPGYSVTQEEINAFHSSNAVFNCWPFLREFVQNTAVRMEFPAPPLPFLLLRPPRPEQESAVPQKTTLTERARVGRAVRSKPSKSA